MSGKSVGIIERAYQLARSGECPTMDDLRRRLAREKYDSVTMHLSGKLIKSQLTTIMAARAADQSAIGPASQQA